MDEGPPVVVEYEVVPHHGPIVPEIRDGAIVPRTATTALSVRWTGHEPSSELSAFVNLLRAQNVDEARDAIQAFEVGSQNFVVISRANDIYWSTQSRIPVRDPRAMTWNAATRMGQSPCHVLPGTGEYEWVGEIEDRYIPHDLNPERGFIATANQDNVGVTQDGDALNDLHFIGCEFDPGHREARITELLDEATADAMATPEDMVRIQGDHQSALGRRISAALIESLDHAEEERATPGTHADLTLAVTEVGATKLAKIRMMRDRLVAWADSEWRAVEGLEDDPSPAGVADSVATSIFNGVMPHLSVLAFSDESRRVGYYPWNGYLVRPLTWGLIAPDRLATYDATLGDTVLWDDLDTVPLESRDDRVLRAFARALDWLETNLGTDMDQWQWGKLHTLRIDTLLPAVNPTRDPLSIPPIPSEIYPDGFPRHGDNFGIDAANYDIFPGAPDFAYGSGPQQRLVVEMTPDGPNIWNALPGGQRLDPDDAHHADEAELWRRNEAPPIWYREIDVVQNAETRIRFTP
jgi:penicillin amidase